MAETKKTTDTPAGPPASKPAEPAAPSVSGPASESGDPAVHQLLAERQTATMNGDDDAIAAVDKRLAELGYAEYRR